MATLADAMNTDNTNTAPQGKTLADAMGTSTTQPKESSNGYFGKGVVETFKDPMRAVKQVGKTLADQWKGVKNTFEEMRTGRNQVLIQNHLDYQAGKKTYAEYAKTIDDEDKPLWDLGSFAIETYAWMSPAGPAVATARALAGTGMVVGSLGQAQTPEELSDTAVQTAEMFGAWHIAGKSVGKLGELRDIVRYGKIKDIKVPVANGATPVKDTTPVATVEVDINSPEVRANIAMQNQMGMHTPETKQVLSKLQKASVSPENAELYHGTDAVYEGAPSVAKAKPTGLFGKGVYFTDDPQIAASYGKNIKFGKAPDLKNVLILDDLGTKEIGVFKRIGMSNENIKYLKSLAFGDKAKLEKETWKILQETLMDENLFESLKKKSSAKHIGYGPYEVYKEKIGLRIRQVLKKEGIDFFRHTGGTRAGSGETLHNVYIALNQTAADNVVSPRKLQKVDLDIPATKLDVPNTKAAIMDNLKYDKMNSIEDLALQLKGIVKKSDNQLQFFKENNESKITAASATKLWNDPDFQAIKSLYQNNAAKNAFAMVEKGELKKYPLSGKGIQNAKAKFLVTVSNAHTIAETVGLKPHLDKMVSMEADATMLYHNYMKGAMGRIDMMRGNEFNLPVKGDPYKHSMAERIGIYLYGSQGPETAAILRNGHKGQIEAYFDKKGNLLNFLTPAELAQAKLMQKTGEMLYPRHSKAHKVLTGEDLPQIKNWFTRQYIRNTLSKTPSTYEEFTLRRMSDAIMGENQLSQSITKEREAFVNGKLNLNAYEVFENMLRQSSKVIALGEHDAKTMVQSVRQLHPHLVKTYGDGVADAWLKTTRAFLVGDTTPKGPADEVLGFLSGQSMGSIISGNAPKIAMTQPAGLFPLIDKIGLKDTMNGLRLTFTPEGKQRVNNDGVHMGRMGDDTVTNILAKESMGRGRYDTARKVAFGYRDFKLAVVKKMDQLIAGAAHLGTYEKVLRETGDPKLATAQAREVEWVTQGSAKSPYRNMLTMEGLTGKLVTPFTVAPSVQFNNILEASIKHSNGAITGTKLIGTYMNNLILPSVYTSMVDLAANAIGMAVQGDSDKIGEDFVDNAVSTVAISTMQQIPVLGSWSQAIRMTGNKVSFPFVRPIEMTIRGISEISKGTIEEDSAILLNGALDSIEAFSTTMFGLGLKLERDLIKKALEDIVSQMPEDVSVARGESRNPPFPGPNIPGVA